MDRQLRQKKFVGVLIFFAIGMQCAGSMAVAQTPKRQVQAPCPEVLSGEKSRGDDGGACPDYGKGNRKSTSPSTEAAPDFVKVHFIAARTASASGFSTKFTKDETLAYVDVRIPFGAQPGEGRFYGGQTENLPPDIRRRREGSYVVLDPVKFAEADDRPQQVRAKLYASLVLQGGRGQHLLYYIHGLNNSWKQAVERIAQIVHGTKFDGAILIYSWPSDDGIVEPLMLLPAKQIILQAKSLVAATLVEVEKQKFQRVTLMTHSMGARLALEALATRSKSNNGPAPERKRHSLVLKAPEPSVIEFGDHLENLQQWTDTITVYCSAEDQALKLLETAEKVDPPGQKLGLCVQPLDGSTWSDAGVSMIEANRGDIDISTSNKDGYWHNSIANSPQGRSDLRRVFDGLSAAAGPYSFAGAALRHVLAPSALHQKQLRIKKAP